MWIVFVTVAVVYLICKGVFKSNRRFSKNKQLLRKMYAWDYQNVRGENRGNKET